MTFIDMILIQMKSHNIPTPFEVHITSLLPSEVAQATFFDPALYPLEIKTLKDAESWVKFHKYIYMVSNYFGKLTVYKVYSEK
ncbi:MAG: hypothetical protein N2505_06505, partial [Endomicrobia bacterium]|nr:hypothetical protein [Endomicrobiia bacterium]